MFDPNEGTEKLDEGVGAEQGAESTAPAEEQPAAPVEETPAAEAPAAPVEDTPEVAAPAAVAVKKRRIVADG